MDHVSSASPSSEWLEELWVVCVYAENGVTLLVGIWWRKKNNKLVEWKANVDTVGIKSASSKDKFLFSSFVAFRTRCKERPQIAICCLKNLGRFRCPATDLDG